METMKHAELQLPQSGNDTEIRAALKPGHWNKGTWKD